MIIGIGVDLRQPNDLLGIDYFAVYHSGNLHIRSACVKADTATVHIAAYRLGGGFGLGLFFIRNIYDLKLIFVNIRHGLHVKVLSAASLIKVSQCCVNLCVTANSHLVAACCPQHKLQNSFGIVAVVCKIFFRTVDLGVVNAHVAVFSVNSDGEGLGCILFECVHIKTHRNEFGFKHRCFFYTYFNVADFHNC